MGWKKGVDMNNIQRICEACIRSGVYTPDQIQALLENGKVPEVHTKSYWNKLGMTPKDDEEGIVCKLWKQDNERFFLVPSILYNADQVTKVRN